MVTGERDLRSSDLCGIVDNVRGEIKERSREGRRTRLSILDRPAPRAPRSRPHNNIYGNYGWFVPSLDSTRPIGVGARKIRSKKTYHLWTGYCLQTTNVNNGHKLFGRNILAFYEIYYFRIIT